MLPAGIAAEIVSLAAAAWPEEACGLVVDGRVVPGTNVLRSRTAFRLDAATTLLLARSLRAGREVVLWHSHTDPGAPAGPSPEDLRAAAPAGEPLHPGLRHAVVDLRSGPRCGVVRYA